MPLELNEQQRRRIAEFEQPAGSLLPSRLSVSLSSLSSACLRHSATTALLSVALYRSTSPPCPLSFLVLFLVSPRARVHVAHNTMTPATRDPPSSARASRAWRISPLSHFSSKVNETLES